MIQYRDYMLVMRLAWHFHAIVFWYTTSVGDYQPLLMPVDENTWRRIGS